MRKQRAPQGTLQRGFQTASQTSLGEEEFRLLQGRRGSPSERASKGLLKCMGVGNIAQNHPSPVRHLGHS